MRIHSALRGIAIFSLCLMCAGSSLAAQGSIYSISTDSAVVGRDYVLIVVRGEQSVLYLADNDESIIYIQQKTATGPPLFFDNIQPSDFEKATAFIIGEDGIVVKKTNLEGVGSNTLSLPVALKVIETEAFEGISASVVIIPEGITSIGSKAFAECTKLERVYIPASVSNIGTDVFIQSPYVVIYGYSGSKAETYAIQNDIQFVSIGNALLDQ